MVLTILNIVRPGGAAERVPEEGADETVGEIFAEAFDGGAAAAFDVHGLSIAADQHGDGGTGSRESVGLGFAFDAGGVGEKIAQGEEGIEEEEMDDPGEGAGEDREGVKDSAHDESQKHEKRDAPAASVGSHGAEARFEPREQVAD